MGTKGTNENPAVELAKEKAGSPDESRIITLTCGLKAKIIPVASSVIGIVSASVPDPEVPTQEIDGRKVENPMHPAYEQALERAEETRVERVNDALINLGLELIDEIPPDEEWMPKLNLMVKMGYLSLDDFDLADPIEREFVFKRYIAVSSTDLMAVGIAARVRSEDIGRLVDSFRHQEEPDSDQEVEAEESAEARDNI
jgi:hypothetical protein